MDGAWLLIENSAALGPALGGILLCIGEPRDVLANPKDDPRKPRVDAVKF